MFYSAKDRFRKLCLSLILVFNNAIAEFYNQITIFVTKSNFMQKLSVTAVTHPDGVITAFINEIPAILVQGNSKEDIQNKLDNVLASYIKRIQNTTFDIQTTSLYA